MTSNFRSGQNVTLGCNSHFICDSCNTGLGRFKNGKDCLKDVLAYLDERESP